MHKISLHFRKSILIGEKVCPQMRSSGSCCPRARSRLINAGRRYPPAAACRADRDVREVAAARVTATTLYFLSPTFARTCMRVRASSATRIACRYRVPGSRGDYADPRRIIVNFYFSPAKLHYQLFIYLVT